MVKEVSAQARQGYKTTSNVTQNTAVVNAFGLHAATCQPDEDGKLCKALTSPQVQCCYAELCVL